MIVDFYKAVGYLPWAIDNYLALLGWSYDDKTEFFTREQLVERFTLERINSSPASFDPKKLWAVQDHVMGGLSTDEKLGLMLPYLVKAGLLTEPPPADAVVGKYLGVRPGLARETTAAHCEQRLFFRPLPTPTGATSGNTSNHRLPIERKAEA